MIANALAFLVLSVAAIVFYRAMTSGSSRGVFSSFLFLLVCCWLFYLTVR